MFNNTDSKTCENVEEPIKVLIKKLFFSIFLILWNFLKKISIWVWNKIFSVSNLNETDKCKKNLSSFKLLSEILVIVIIGLIFFHIYHKKIYKYLNNKKKSESNDDDNKKK